MTGAILKRVVLSCIWFFIHLRVKTTLRDIVVDLRMSPLLLTTPSSSLLLHNIIIFPCSLHQILRVHAFWICDIIFRRLELSAGSWVQAASFGAADVGQVVDEEEESKDGHEMLRLLNEDDNGLRVVCEGWWVEDDAEEAYC